VICHFRFSTVISYQVKSDNIKPWLVVRQPLQPRWGAPGEYLADVVPMTMWASAGLDQQGPELGRFVT